MYVVILLGTDFFTPDQALHADFDIVNYFISIPYNDSAV